MTTSANEIYRRAIRKARAQTEALIKRVYVPEENLTKVFLKGKLIAVTYHENLSDGTPGEPN